MTRYKNGIDERRRLISILAETPHEGAALYAACEGAMVAIYLEAGTATRALAARPRLPNSGPSRFLRPGRRRRRSGA